MINNLVIFALTVIVVLQFFTLLTMGRIYVLFRRGFEQINKEHDPELYCQSCRKYKEIVCFRCRMSFAFFM